MSKKKFEHLGAVPIDMSKKPVAPSDPKLTGTLQAAQPARRPARHITKRTRVIGLVVVSVLIIVSLAFVVVWRLHTDSTNKQVVAHVCTESSNPALKETVATFLPGQHDKLQQVVQKIMKLKNYQEDPNCLYVVIVYDISIENTQAARYNLYLLQKVYNPQQGFNPLFGKNITITNLETEVTALENASKMPVR